MRIFLYSSYSVFKTFYILILKRASNALYKIFWKLMYRESALAWKVTNLWILKIDKMKKMNSILEGALLVTTNWFGLYSNYPPSVWSESMEKSVKKWKLEYISKDDPIKMAKLVLKEIGLGLMEMLNKKSQRQSFVPNLHQLWNGIFTITRASTYIVTEKHVFSSFGHGKQYSLHLDMERRFLILTILTTILTSPISNSPMSPVKKTSRVFILKNFNLWSHNLFSWCKKIK